MSRLDRDIGGPCLVQGLVAGLALEDPHQGREHAAPGGDLAGYFYFDADERGPPFALRDAGQLAELLSPAFERLEDAAVGDSIDVFKGKERWQVWKRR